MNNKNYNITSAQHIEIIYYGFLSHVQYIPRIMHVVHTLLWFRFVK